MLPNGPAILLAASLLLPLTLPAGPPPLAFEPVPGLPARTDGGQRVRVAPELGAVRVGDRLALPLSAAEPILNACVVERSEPRPGSLLLRARAEGLPESDLVFISRGGLWVAEFVLSPHRRWTLEDDGGGLQLLRSVGPQKAPACATCQGPRKFASMIARPAAAPAISLSASPASVQTFDLLIAYTQRALLSAGSVAALEASFDLGLARSNAVYANSGLPLRGRIVGTVAAEFTEVGSIYLNLDRARSDPSLRAQRDALGAHFVSVAIEVLPESQKYGAGDLLPTFSARWGLVHGYSVIDHRLLREGPVVLTHELGHNMGCDHELVLATPARIRAEAVGWSFLAPNFHDYCTVMGHQGVLIERFSDPARYYQGTATGKLGVANNSSIVRRAMPYFLRFRPRPPPARAQVRTLVAEASFQAGTAAELVFSRSGGVPELPLEVFPLFTFGSPEADFQMEGLEPSGLGTFSLTIPAGATERRVRILPRGAASADTPPPARPVLLSLATSEDYDYELGESAAAEFTVRDRGPYLAHVPRAAFLNLSSRLWVGEGDAAGIAGFVLRGDAAKRCLIRALGPSLGDFGVSGVLDDPTLELRDAAGRLVAANQAWGEDGAAAEVVATGLAPVQPGECALLRTLAPGAYTALVRGTGAGTGVALIEVYDLEPSATTQPVNLSTRGRVASGDAVLIAGFVLTGDQTRRILVRALGPSLADFAVGDALADPALELRDASGNLVAENDQWQSTQATEIRESGFAPRQAREAALIRMLAPGSYTALVRGVGPPTGIGLVEVYDLGE